MILKITKAMVEEIGAKKLEPFGIDPDGWSWRSGTQIDLDKLRDGKITQLRAVLEPHKDVRGMRGLIRDIDIYMMPGDKVSTTKISNLRQFHELLTKYLREVPGHRIYEPIGIQELDANVAYYVAKVTYHMEDRYSPEHVTMKLLWQSFGGVKSEEARFYGSDARYMTVPDAIHKKGYRAEVDELRQTYLAELEKYNAIADKIGKQYLAEGTATDDMDGNPEGREDSHWRRTHTLNMMKDGEPTKVVIDVFSEEDKKERDRAKEPDFDPWYWERKTKDQDGDDDAIAAPMKTEAPKVEIPVHPMCAVFDLRRHLRLQIHVNHLTEYKYNETISDSLILPRNQKELVEMLIEHKSGGFVDIISGKSGGAVVLLAGPPGVGKTLTAEVYAEHEHRALYSVQCSQLGIEPTELEENLLKSFTRAGRWNAVLLLDEADVYIRKRGGNLQQNAIVGVFLRVLEYQDSVLFLTTNRPEDVDDAIGSRCMARIDYPIPSTEDQRKIWRVLAAASRIELHDDTIQEISERNPSLSGRDVKNLLKLGHLISQARGEKITPDTIDYVKLFKPTRTGEQ